MRTNIVLANIGNSNIRHSSLPNDMRNPETSFRAATESLWNSYESKSAEVSVAILPSLLDHIHLPNGRVILYGSDNPEGDNNYQDTIYATRIVARKLGELYPQLSFEARPSNVRPVDGDGLMCFFRNELLVMGTDDPEAHFFYCDAGGTPQQKTALKLNLEFLVPSEQLHVFAVERDRDRGSVVNKSEPVEYRRMINQILAKKLVDQFDYGGALSLTNSSGIKKRNPGLFPLIQLSDFLFSNNLNEIHKVSKLPESANVLLEKKNLNAEMFAMTVILDIAHCYWRLGNFSLSVLYYHIFFERAMSYCIAEHLEGTKPFLVEGFEKGINWQIDKRVSNADDWRSSFFEALMTGDIFPDFNDHDAAQKWTSPSTPVKLKLVRSLKDDFSKELISKLSEGQCKQLSGFRNKIAHEGRHITKASVKPFNPYFMAWRYALNLDPEVTIFDRLNTLINQQLLH